MIKSQLPAGTSQMFCLVEALKIEDVAVYHSCIPDDEWEDYRVRLEIDDADFMAIHDDTAGMHVFATCPRRGVQTRQLADPGVIGFMWLRHGKENSHTSERWARFLAGVI
jgi:hypothetical protein